MTEGLGHKQIAVMLTLMALAREVSNPELESLVGFTLTGDERKNLVKGGLIVSQQRGRAYAHELTDEGWAWCGTHLASQTPPPPRPRSVLAVAMYVVLGGLDGYLRRENLSIATVFAPKIEVTPEEVEKRIRAAYRKLAQSPRDWVDLVELRPMLGDAPTPDVDAVLKELSRKGEVHLAPKSNRKLLSDAEQAAAVRLGGEDNHRLLIGAP
jgi:hypothetical protein